MTRSGVHVLAVPTPFAVGRVNCYLIEDDPLTLVDAGPNSGTSLVTLERALAEHGRRVEDLERIVLTHQHIDHIGLAQILADRSGAEICALDRLGPWLARYAEGMEGDDRFAEAVMIRHGIPADLVQALRAVTQQFRAWGASVTVTRPLRDGETLEFAGRAWTVHHRPGHSPSDTAATPCSTRSLSTSVTKKAFPPVRSKSPFTNSSPSRTLPSMDWSSTRSCERSSGISSAK